MRILHIASSFIQSNLYLELFNELDKLEIHQDIYCAVRTLDSKVDLKLLSNNIKYQISNILKLKDRFLFHNKINKVTKDLENKFTVRKYDIIHAHYLYSDGAVAYKLYKKYGVKYIITVRNTDINLFYKYRLLLRKYFSDIINNAEKIIFISPAYQNKFFNIISKYKNSNELKQKSIVITNAINPFWIEHSKNKYKILDKNKVRFLFIGDLNANKNIINIIKSLVNYDYNFGWELNIVGPDRGIFNKIKPYLEYTNIIYHGKIYDKNKLKKIYNNSDIFIMPSHKETFGLVYIEALSQGLPVICSKNQAIDGLFKENYIVETVNPSKLDSIYKGILNLVDRYNDIQQFCQKESQNFTWHNKASKLKEIYKEINYVNKI